MKIAILLLCLYTLASCDDQEGSMDCEHALLVSPQFFSGDSHPVTISDVKVDGNCLELSFGFSGCSGDVPFALADAGTIAESYPVQRSLKLVVENAGLCEAFFEKTASFDLTNAQIAEYNTIIFNLDGWEQSFSYTY